jgi:hypothetical protein
MAPSLVHRRWFDTRQDRGLPEEFLECNTCCGKDRLEVVLPQDLHHVFVDEPAEVPVDLPASPGRFVTFGVLCQLREIARFPRRRKGMLVHFQFPLHQADIGCHAQRLRHEPDVVEVPPLEIAAFEEGPDLVGKDLLHRFDVDDTSGREHDLTGSDEIGHRRR